MRYLQRTVTPCHHAEVACTAQILELTHLSLSYFFSDTSTGPHHPRRRYECWLVVPGPRLSRLWFISRVLVFLGPGQHLTGCDCVEEDIVSGSVADDLQASTADSEEEYMSRAESSSSVL